jgi:hypothetical protein
MSKRRHSGDHSTGQVKKRAKRSCLTLLDPFTFLITRYLGVVVAIGLEVVALNAFNT